MIASLILLLLSAAVDVASAQLPARVETPYTLMDAESRIFLEGGVEYPLRGNGPDRLRLLVLYETALPR
jgi:hypothetical protein